MIHTVSHSAIDKQRCVTAVYPECTVTVESLYHMIKTTPALAVTGRIVRLAFGST